MTSPSPRLASLAALSALLAGCAGDDIIYKPASQILPAHIQSLAVQPVKNMTQQFGLEDKLTRGIIDEFLRNGQYRILPESSADGVVQVKIHRYLLIPTQYDAVLTPTAYKLRVVLDVKFVDRIKNRELWVEENLEGIQTYNAPTVAGGITEEQARELIWDVLARDIVRRTVEGFGAVSGASKRDIGAEKDDKFPPNKIKPALPSKPLNPDPY